MDNKAELLRLLRLAWAADHVSAADCRKIDTILAAPAEDVRAVGEEPVAWVVNWAGSGEKYCVVEPGWRAERLLADRDFKATPLCRHPQCPVVLPERVDPDFFDSIRATGIGWNACIDEFERLNKC